MQNPVSIYQKLTAVLIIFSGILVVFLYLPQFMPPSTPPRQAAMIFLTLSLLLIFTHQMINAKKLEIFSTPLIFPLILWLIVNILSLTQSSGKLPASFTVISILGSVIFYFLIPQIIHSKRQIAIILYTLSIFISLSGLAPLLSKTAIYPQPLKSYLQSVFGQSSIAINTTGATYVTGLLLLIFLPVVVALCLQFLKNIRPLKIVLGAVIITLYSLSVLITLKTLLPINSSNIEIPSFLDRKIGWMIATETIKNRPLFGIGPANFINAYTLYKPLYLPNISYPDLSFQPASLSSNEIFMIIATNGILGSLIYFLFILKSVYYLFPKLLSKNPIIVAISISFFIYVLSQALLPTPAILTFFIFIFLGLVQSLINENKPSLICQLPQNKEEDSLKITIIPFTITLALSIIIVFLTFKTLMGEFYEKQAIDFISKNDGQKALDFAQKAVDQNPINDSYRINIAQIAYSLGVSTFQQKSASPAGELSDADKNLISQLLQKSIAESKKAVDLNPEKAYNISTLAAIYSGLAQILPEAQQFSLEAYNRAIQIDPTNPKLKLELGGIYFGKSEFATASAIFQDAVLLQANYANAHYNLGYGLLRLNQFSAGLSELQRAADLTPPDSADHQKVLSEIESIQAQIASLSGSLNPKPSATPPPKP